MKALEKCWAYVLYILNALSLSDHGKQVQEPLGGILSHLKDLGGPVFSPPSAPDNFTCNYTLMGKSWSHCTHPNDRACWLTNGTFNYSIFTNYEKLAPTGILRKYELDVTKMTLEPDGYKFTEGQVFNKQYPGPWIQACWGDTVEVNVTNHLKHNGTTIHWHGIRQYRSMEMDGVNGVTQCPIAPNDYFVYRFNVTQYGTSWYHSHYSLQYANGLLGPMTLHGPSSAEYDDHIDPILMTDWNHQSAFELFWEEITPGKGPPAMLNTLMNGIGQYKCNRTAGEDETVCVDRTDRYNTTVTPGKKYLLRLINTSVDTTYIFAIDNHNLTVISSDFVPISPYSTNAVLVGIGQRYHVVLEAKDLKNPDPGAPPKGYWIRTAPAAGCNSFSTTNPPDTRTGVLFYKGADKKIPPTTTIGFTDFTCSDEPYASLKPIVPWTVGKPRNDQQGSTFAVGLSQEDPAPPLPPGGLNFSRWEMSRQPLYVNFGDPTILHVNQNKGDWAPNLVVIGEAQRGADPDHAWVYLLVSTQGFPFGNINRNFVPASHPIHLHGHDFVILQQSTTPYWDNLGYVNLTMNNPPRRDVALLPGGGFLILAFKSDNPGAWLIHCHIAWHASSGLAAQLLERDGNITRTPETLAEANRTCNNWNKWSKHRVNWANPDADSYQDDSGV